MQYPKTHNSFFFTPALELKVMMQWCHLENTTTQKSSSKDLDNHTNRFDKKDKTEQWQKQHFVDDNRIDGEQCAEAERPHVTHLKARWFDVEIGIGNKSTDYCCIEDSYLGVSSDPGKQQKRRESNDQRSASQSIHAIGNIDRIGRKHHKKNDERNNPPANIDKSIKRNMNGLPVFTKLKIDPPGSNSSCYKLEEESFMHMHTFAGVRTKPEGSAFEQCPGECDDEPEAGFDTFVNFYQAQGVFDITIAAFVSINIEDVINASKKGREQHDRNRYPGEFALPVEEHGNNCDRDNHEQPSHDRSAGLVFASIHRQSCIVRIIPDNFVFVEEFDQKW